MTDDIPGLKIEDNGDGTLTLEQEWSGNVDRIAIHPIHVRHLAERLGLIRAPGAEWNQIPPARTLARRLLVLRDRITELDGRLWAVPVFPAGSAGDDPDLSYSDASLTFRRSADAFARNFRAALRGA